MLRQCGDGFIQSWKSKRCVHKCAHLVFSKKSESPTAPEHALNMVIICYLRKDNSKHCHLLWMKSQFRRKGVSLVSLICFRFLPTILNGTRSCHFLKNLVKAPIGTYEVRPPSSQGGKLNSQKKKKEHVLEDNKNNNCGQKRL